MIKLKEQKKIILEDFDFNKIELVFRTMGWKWVDESRKEFIPSINELKSVAELCLDGAIKSEEDEESICIAGFESLKINGMLELRFIIEKCNSLNLLK
jgi:hypothetical protein